MFIYYIFFGRKTYNLGNISPRTENTGKEKEVGANSMNMGEANIDEANIDDCRDIEPPEGGIKT